MNDKITKLRAALMRRFEFDQCIHASSIDDEIERWMKEMGIGQRVSTYDIATQSYAAMCGGGGGHARYADGSVYTRANAAVAQEVQKIVAEKKIARSLGDALDASVMSTLFPVHYGKWDGNT